MAILYNSGDGIQGERIIAEYRKMGKPELVNLTGGHKGSRVWFKGLPAKAFIEKPLRVAKN